VIEPVTVGDDEPDVGVDVGVLDPQAASIKAAAAAKPAIPALITRLRTLFLPYGWNATGRS
jgi:hypothetical protein